MMSGDGDGLSEQMEERIRTAVEESVAKQLACVVSSLKDVTKGIGAGASNTAGGGNCQFFSRKG